jgi:hypothetical protein
LDPFIIEGHSWYKYIVEENLSNRKPILYLGKDRVNGAYYFLGAKEGVGRFIKYLVYPMWCTGNMIGNFLDLGADVPTEILEELMLFVNGKVDYELLPAKRGRAESVVRTDLAAGSTRRIQTNPERSIGTVCTIQVTEGTKSEHVGSSGDTSVSIPESKIRYKDSNAEKLSSGNVGTVGSEPGHSPSSGAKLPRRRSSSGTGILDKSGDLQIVPQSEASTVQAADDSTSKTLASQNEGVQPVKRPRGRPPKIKPLD